MNLPNHLGATAGQGGLGTGPIRNHDPRAFLSRLTRTALPRSHRRATRREAADALRLDRMIDLFEHRTCDCL
jgi:hypothetical protein